MHACVRGEMHMFRPMSTLNDASDDIFFENELTKEKPETFLLVALLVFCVNEISAFQAIGLLHFMRNCE